MVVAQLVEQLALGAVSEMLATRQFRPTVNIY